MVQRHDHRVDSGDVQISSALFLPPGPGPFPALVICHGMPAGPQAAPDESDGGGGELGYPALAEWCAWEGFATVIFNFRGTGESGGNFHHMGWVQDLEAVLSWVAGREEVDSTRLVLLGSSLGAAVAIYVAARRKEVAGVVSFASPATMRPRDDPADAVERLRSMGVIRDPDFPPSLVEWAQEGARLSPVEWIADVAPRPLLLLHGDADDVVPPESVFLLHERAGEPKTLRMLPGVGHRFRQEETAIGAALDWLKDFFIPHS